MKDTSVASVVIVPEVLTFDNYDRWSVFIKNYLIGKGLWGVVIGDDDTDHFNRIRDIEQDDDGLSVEHKKLFRMVKRGDSIEETKVDPNVYDVIITSDSERTLLHIAVNAGNIKNVEILVREGGDKFVTKKDKHRDTALSLIQRGRCFTQTYNKKCR